LKNLRALLFDIAVPFCIGICVSDSAFAANRGTSLAVAATCPQGTSYTNVRGDGDGCAGAPTGTVDNITLFQHPTFFSGYANQSGQTYITRPVWNVAGVDYPVGIPGGTSFLDPTVASLPSGCTYSPTGSSTGGPVVNCTGTVNASFIGYDFTGTKVGSHGCIVLQNQANGTGIFTVKNSYFCTDSVNNAGMIGQVNGAGDIPFDIENCVFNGNALNTNKGASAITLSSAPHSTLKYNVFKSIPGRPVASNALGADIMEYNYLEDMNFNGSQGHGEFEINTGQGTHTQTIWAFNTMLLTPASYYVQTSLLYVSAGYGTVTWADAEILNNVGIINDLNGGRGGEGFVDYNQNQTASLFEDNYIDSTGSFYRSAVQGATCAVPIIQARNYNLITGAAVTLTNLRSPGC
jgi:hypothetical protein